MINFDAISEKVFNILRGFGLQLKMYTLSGESTYDPNKARRFFSEDPNVMITVDVEDSTIKFFRSKYAPIDQTRNLIKSVRVLAMKYLLNFDLRVFGEVITPKTFAHQAIQYANKEKEVMEGSMSPLVGYTKTSYQYVGEDVKLIIRHSAAVDENVRGSRSRNIKSIYVENRGEKTRLPFTNLLGARAIARHLSNEGLIDDAIGQHIVTSAKQYSKLKEFIRYTQKNGLLSEETWDIISSVKENLQKVRHDLRRLTGAKTYHEAVENIQSSAATTTDDEDNQNNVKELFTVKYFNPDFEEILPTINELVAKNRKFYEEVDTILEDGVQIDPFSSDLSVMSFESKNHELAYRMQMAAESINNEQVSRFIKRIGEKIGSDIALNETEIRLTRKFFETPKNNA